MKPHPITRAFAVTMIALSASSFGGCVGATDEPTPYVIIQEGRMPAANVALNVTVNDEPAWSGFNKSLFNGTAVVDFSKAFVVVSVLNPGNDTIHVDRATIKGDVFNVYFKVSKGEPYDGPIPSVSIVKLDRRGIKTPIALVVHERA
ncbi:MAG: hypothetical protein HY556_08130 [Euryarchaeota archaeon]|nr:hypothetical protein [Euryarchaeota archaeon]